MSRAEASEIELGDARAVFADRVQAAADEMARQAFRARTGLPYQAARVRARMEAIDEAREIVIALHRVDAVARLTA